MKKLIILFLLPLVSGCITNYHQPAGSGLQQLAIHSITAGPDIVTVVGQPVQLRGVVCFK